MSEYLSARDLATRFGCSKSSVWSMVNEPSFPRRYRLGGPQLVRWHRAEIEAWEAERRVG